MYQFITDQMKRILRCLTKIVSLANNFVNVVHDVNFSISSWLSSWRDALKIHEQIKLRIKGYILIYLDGDIL